MKLKIDELEKAILTEVSPDELEKVVGGFSFESAHNCWFDWNGTVRTDKDGKQTFKCKRNCFNVTTIENLPWYKCGCHDTDQCHDKFHHVNNKCK